MSRRYHDAPTNVVWQCQSSLFKLAQMIAAAWLDFLDSFSRKTNSSFSVLVSNLIRVIERRVQSIRARFFALFMITKLKCRDAGRSKSLRQPKTQK